MATAGNQFAATTGGRFVHGAWAKPDSFPKSLAAVRSVSPSRRLRKNVAPDRTFQSFTPIASTASAMAYTTARMSASNRRPMLPMRKVSAWLILPG